MAQVTIPVKISKRKAREERLLQFDALAAFANLSDNSEDWRKFRLQYPEFFPLIDSGFGQPGFRNLTDWLYTFAEEWAQFPVETRAKTIPSLLWYRDRLRAFWTRNDPNGINLSFLLGFMSEDEVSRRASASDFGEPERLVFHPMAVPGQSLNPLQHDSIGGLPRGRFEVDGIALEIKWVFACQLQRAVYDLMQDHWRAMVCPNCGKYFVADKTAQKFCSIKCYGEKKQEKSLKYYYQKGRKARQEMKSRKARSQKRRQK